jgi:hypothetical protein
VVQLYSVRHSGDMARIRDTAPVNCRGFVIFEVRHAKRPGDLWISSTAVRYEVSDALGSLDLEARAFDAALRNAFTLSKRWLAMPPVEIKIHETQKCTRTSWIRMVATSKPLTMLTV